MEKRIKELVAEGKSLLDICIQLVKVEQLGTLNEVNGLAREIMGIPPVVRVVQPDAVIEDVE